MRFTKPGGKRVRKTTGTASREEAQQCLDAARSASWREATLGEKPPYTWDETALRWLEEKADKRDYRGDVQKIARLTPYLTKMPLKQITRDKIMKVIKEKISTSSRSTANRYLALICAIFRAAYKDWQWIEASDVPPIKMFKEPAGRLRWLEQGQVEKLLQHLPPHQRYMTLFALATGLRQANVKNLKWSQIDMSRRIAIFGSNEVKSGKPLGITLNDVAMGVLRAVAGQHADYVFTFRGKPVDSVNTKAWQKALKAAGIEDFRWHDLRHTWASWLRQSGVDLATIQEMGGWKDPAMTQRYAHLEVAHLRSFARNIDKRLGKIEGDLL